MRCIIIKTLEIPKGKIEKATIYHVTEKRGELTLSEKYMNQYLYVIIGEQIKEDEEFCTINASDIFLRRGTARFCPVKSNGEVHQRKRAIVYIPSRFFDKDVWVILVENDKFMKTKFEEKDMHKTRVKREKGLTEITLPKKYAGKDVEVFFELKW
jgi:hypothetical protein